MEKKDLTNTVNHRILSLSPSVKQGLEKECCREDFYSEGDKPIGKGGFGQVWKVRHKTTNKIYVIKVMNKTSIIDQKMVDQINREIEIMYKLCHPHIIQLYSHFEDDKFLYLIMHYASKGQLYSLLKKRGRFDQRTASQYMREVISAVRYIHSFNPPIIHRDIKPENILLDENGRVKLADFGWSNFVNKNKDLRRTYCGTPEYLAPEMINKEGHDTSIDIWALGVLLFELLSGQPPFKGYNQKELFSNIQKHRIYWPNDFPLLAKNLISQILNQNPKERPSLDAIINHPWFEANQPLMPVLTEKTIDENQWLSTYVINPKNDNISKRKSIIEMIRKLSAQNNSRQVNTEENPIPPDDENNPMILQLNEMNEKLKKEIQELKKRNEKLEIELKTVKTEMLKLKDSNLPNQDKKEILLLKDEIERYKVQNSDRIRLYDEIQSKEDELRDLKFKQKEKECELEAMRKNNEVLNKKYIEEKAQNLAFDEKMEELKNEIKKKDEQIAEFAKKFELLKEKVIIDVDSMEDSNLRAQNFLKLINDSITGFQNTFLQKINRWETYVNETKGDMIKAEEKKISEVFTVFCKSVNEAAEKISKLINEGDIKFHKLSSENSEKIKERIEWQNKKIQDLMSIKLKQVETFEDKFKVKEEELYIEKKKTVALEKQILEKSKKLLTVIKEKKNLEAKLGDIKDFIFRTCQDKLDEFDTWIHFTPNI